MVEDNSRKVSENKLNNIFKRLLLVAVGIVLYFSFEYIYKTEISPDNRYLGLTFNQLTLSEYAVSLLFFLFPLVWLPITLKRPSDLAVWFLYLFSYTSTTFMAFHVTRRQFENVLSLLFLMLLGFIITSVTRKHRYNIVFKQFMHRKIPLDKVFIGLVVLVCVYSLSLTDFKLNLDVTSVYQRRLEAREVPGFVHGYVLAFGRSVVTVLGVYLIVVKKRYVYLFLVLIFTLASFSFDGTKGSIVIPVFLLAIAFMIIRTRNLSWLLGFSIVLIGLAVIELGTLSNNIISEYFVRRIFAIPGFLSTAFWDFFSVHDKVLLTDSVGKYLFTPVYDVAPTFLIGIDYMDNPQINANVGIWMGGFAHFGISGILLVSIISGLILGLVDNMTHKNFFVLGCLICSYLGITWSEQMIHTSMLSGGVFYLLLVLIMILKSRGLQIDLAHTYEIHQ